MTQSLPTLLISVFSTTLPKIHLTGMHTLHLLMQSLMSTSAFAPAAKQQQQRNEARCTLPHSRTIVQNALSCSPQEIVEKEGLAELGGTEAVVLGSLSTQIRSCIATCGGGGGAAARGDCWRYLFGFVTVWLGEQHTFVSVRVTRSQIQT